MTFAEKLDQAIREGRFFGLTLYQSGARWQASLQAEQGGGWRVEIEDTPIAALEALFAAVPAAGVFD